MNMFSIVAVVVFYWFLWKFVAFLFRKFKSVVVDVKSAKAKLSKKFSFPAVDKSDGDLSAKATSASVGIESYFAKALSFSLMFSKGVCSVLVGTWKFVANFNYARSIQWFIIRRKKFDSWYSGKPY